MITFNGNTYRRMTVDEFLAQKAGSPEEEALNQRLRYMASAVEKAVNSNDLERINKQIRPLARMEEEFSGDGPLDRKAQDILQSCLQMIKKWIDDKEAGKVMSKTRRQMKFVKVWRIEDIYPDHANPKDDVEAYVIAILKANLAKEDEKPGGWQAQRIMMAEHLAQQAERLTSAQFDEATQTAMSVLAVIHGDEAIQ